MAKLNGTDVLIYTSTDGGSTWKAVAHTSSATLGIEAATIEVTDKGSGGWSEFLGGVKSWTMEGEGFINYGTGAPDTGVSDLFDLLIGDSTVQVRFTTNKTGDRIFSGTALVTSLSQEAPSEDAATYSMSFQGTGALAMSAPIA